MAIEKFGSGAFNDSIITNGSVSQTSAAWLQADDAGGAATIAFEYRGAFDTMVLTSAGEMKTLSAFLDDGKSGGVDTITGQIIGAGANVVVAGGVMQNLVEYKSGKIQVLEEDEGSEAPEIIALNGEKGADVKVPEIILTKEVKVEDGEAPEIIALDSEKEADVKSSEITITFFEKDKDGEAPEEPE